MAKKKIIYTAKDGPKEKMEGAPLKPVDEKLITYLASIHCTMEEIAAGAECTVELLERRFMDKIKKAKALGTMSLRRRGWEQAMTSENPTILKMHLQSKLGFADKVEQKNEDVSQKNSLEKVVETLERLLSEDKT